MPEPEYFETEATKASKGQVVPTVRNSATRIPASEGVSQFVSTQQASPSSAGGLDLEMIDESVNPVASQNDLDAIAQANAQYAPPPAATLTPQTAVGNQGNASIMPTLNQPINVGTSSGQITGSHGVYVDPGFVAPWGVMMEQQKQKQVAQQEQDKLANQSAREAHAAKKDKDKAFKFDRPKGPVADDPHFQADLDKRAKSLIDGKIDIAKELYGKDWQVALKSDTEVGRKFTAEMDGLNLIARNANYMTEKFGEIEAGLKDGSTYYSPEVVKRYQDYQSASSKYFEDGDTEELGKMRQLMSKLDGEMELNNFIKDSGIMANVVGEITGGTSVSNFGDFMKLRTSDKISYKKNIDAMVKNIMMAKGPNSDYSEDHIKTVLEGHLQNKSKSKTTLKSKTKGGGSGGGMTSGDININEEAHTLQVDNTRAGEGVEVTDSEGNVSLNGVKNYNVTRSIPLKQTKTGFNLTGMQEINEDGSFSEIANVQKAKPVSLVDVDVVDGDGNHSTVQGVEVQYQKEVPIKQTIAQSFTEAVKYEMVDVTKVVKYEEMEAQMRTIFDDEVNDAFKTTEVEEDYNL